MNERIETDRICATCKRPLYAMVNMRNETDLRARRRTFYCEGCERIQSACQCISREGLKAIWED